jgi:methionyl-tRNA synthetase
LDDGLRARSVTRDLDWGVKVPLPDAEGKVLYVWFDAPIGYISATRQWAKDTGRDWKEFWQDPQTKLVHFLGKDNIVFHCIFFPSMLKAHGDYILPANVPANEFMNMEGDKLSTSRNWAVWVPDYLERFEGKQDILRYVLTANLPETKDSEFTWRDYQSRANNELVATFGNFINRVLVLCKKYYGGEVPHADPRLELAGAEQDSEHKTARGIMAELAVMAGTCGDHIRAYRFRDAQRVMMEMASFGNGFLQFNEPWKYQKSDPEQVKAVMFCALQIVDLLALVVEPFLPFTAERIRRMLNKPSIVPGDLAADLRRIIEGGELLKAGDQLGEPELLFEKVEDEIVQRELDRLAAVKAARLAESDNAGSATASTPSGKSPEAAAVAASTQSTATLAEPVNKEETKPSNNLPELKAEITYEDFARLDIRTGTIIEAERMPKADKLLRLQVELGFEQRTIVSGIAEHFDPAELAGRRVIVLANLAPRKLRGVESQGMILMAEDAAGKLVFVGPEDGIPNGSAIS